MKLTSQEEYGLRCLLQIASAPEQFLTIPEVARREALSTAYVAKLMRLLRRAGFVRSVRGQNGGFELALPAAQVNVGAVLDSLGGRLYSEAFCRAHSGERTDCVHTVDCALRPLWTAMDAALQNVLNRTQLSHLIHGQCHVESWLRAGEQGVSASGLQRVSQPPPEGALGKVLGETLGAAFQETLEKTLEKTMRETLLETFQDSLQETLQDALASDNPVAITKRSEGPH